jgi:hypothetical protein
MKKNKKTITVASDRPVALPEFKVIPMSSVELDADIDLPSETTTPAAFRKMFEDRKPIVKPDISRLLEALDSAGLPLFKAGDNIVIERYSIELEDRPYIDTRTLRVVSVDADTGLIRLYDESLGQHALSDWKNGPKMGITFKLSAGTAVNTKKKRGRPRKNPAIEPANAVTVKKVPGKRGRPKGSKNRSGEVVAAEKIAKMAKIIKKARR